MRIYQFTLLIFWITNAVSGQKIDSLITQYGQVAERFLIKGPRARGYFSINELGISMYATPADKLKSKAEITVHWRDLPIFLDLMQYGDRKFQFDAYQKFGISGIKTELAQTIFILKENYRPFLTNQNLPLSGVKIAIDPGHVAGDFATAKSEGRFIDIESKGKKYQFYEAELALTTALLLRDSLVKFGAEVLLTRTQGNQAAFGKSYQQWLQTDFKLILKRKGYTNTQIDDQIKNLNRSLSYYKYFLDADLDARADKINYFNPDITVIIHFNADYYNTGWNKPTKRNYSMAFVPGAFLGGELYSREMRFDFLRLLVSTKIQKSLSLSQLVVREFENQLKVPPVKAQDEPPYLKDNSLKVAKGVYARNLRLNRLINSVLCYGEPLLQDNEHELEELSKNDLSSGKISPRVEKTAQAYLKAILSYVYEIKTQKP